MDKLLWKLSAAVILSCCPQLMSQTLLNGGFEAANFPTPPFHKYVPSEAPLLNWTVGGTGVGESSYLMDFAAPGSPYKFIEGASGAHALRLSYGDVISQIITDLIPGKKYELRLAVQGYAEFGSLRVQVGETTTTVEPSPEGQRTIFFVASEENMLLSIIAVPSSPEYDYDVRGITIDDVRVIAYQAPASLAVALYPGVSISGDVGATYRIEYASSLAPTNWTVLTNIVLTSSPHLFFDATAPQSEKRFYRAANSNSP